MRFLSRGKLQLFYISCFSFLVFNLSAQLTSDSIQIGIISVKRPAIPAIYSIHLAYFDPDSLQKQIHITEFSTKQIVFGDSGISSIAPQPFIGDRTLSDTVFTGDSFSRNNLPPSSSSENKFDWLNYLKLISWQFFWSDSTKRDSAQFEFTIDKNGNATCKALPWKNADSTCRAFEKKSFPYLFLLSEWLPARRNKVGVFHRKGKFRNVPCIVIVTVYAYDPNAGKSLPVEIIDK